MFLPQSGNFVFSQQQKISPYAFVMITDIFQLISTLLFYGLKFFCFFSFNLSCIFLCNFFLILASAHSLGIINSSFIILSIDLKILMYKCNQKKTNYHNILLTSPTKLDNIVIVYTNCSHSFVLAELGCIIDQKILYVFCLKKKNFYLSLKLDRQFC